MPVLRKKDKLGLSVVVAKGARACALVLQCSIKMMKDKPEFKHGVTKKEMTEYFPRLMGFELVTYDGRMRDNVLYNKTMARHDVHRERHFYPLILDEEGLVDHSRCNCQK